MNVITRFPVARDYLHDFYFQAIFEGAAIGIGICQLDGRIVDANPALARMLGCNQQELTGTRAHELYPELHRALNLDSPSPDDHFLRELLRGERDSFEIEKRYRRKDGSEFWGHLTVSVARDARHQPAFWIAALVDATGHKRLEDHLREAEKMEIIGRLAGGIAHDFNNLLTGVLLYCDLITAELERARSAAGASAGPENELERATLAQHVEEVRMAGEQGAAMTQQLLAVARKQAAEPRPVALNEIVASTGNLLRRLIGEQIELVTAFDSGAGPVLADPAQLRQVLLNLVLNARDAMPQGGKIRVITRAVDLPREFPRGPGSLRARRAVSLAVQDNGSGMDAETRSRLFEPFFTTKKEGEGTGLGLATVQRIVSEAGGIIEVDSAPGRGTCIEVFFPALPAPLAESPPLESANLESANLESTPVESPLPRSPLDGLSIPAGAAGIAAPAAPPYPRGAPSPASPATILLVDDDAPARKSMQRVLRDAGYSVLPAAGAQAALAAFAEHSANVDLLIADCMMPGMPGPVLAATLRRQKADLKILLVSGYRSAPLETASGAVELIRKPFSGRALLDRVLEICRGDGPSPGPSGRS